MYKREKNRKRQRILKNSEMAIKHLSGYSKKELKKLNPDIPVWKRKELIQSPFIIFIGLGYVFAGIFFAVFMIIRFLFLSPIRGFTDAKWLCKLGVHKMRKYDHNSECCKICFYGATSERQLRNAKEKFGVFTPETNEEMEEETEDEEWNLDDALSQIEDNEYTSKGTWLDPYRHGY